MMRKSINQLLDEIEGIEEEIDFVKKREDVSNNVNCKKVEKLIQEMNSVKEALKNVSGDNQEARKFRSRM